MTRPIRRRTAMAAVAVASTLGTGIATAAFGLTAGPAGSVAAVPPPCHPAPAPLGSGATVRHPQPVTIKPINHLSILGKANVSDPGIT